MTIKRLPNWLYTKADFDCEYYDVDEDFNLGTASLALPGNLPAGAPIQVTFTLNKEGMLVVTGVV